MRISCPPTIAPCYYGVDTPSKDDLIAAKLSVDEVCRFIGADSLGYLSIDGMRESIGLESETLCTACWDDAYPTAVNGQ